MLQVIVSRLPTAGFLVCQLIYGLRSNLDPKASKNGVPVNSSRNCGVGPQGERVYSGTDIGAVKRPSCAESRVQPASLRQ